MTFQDLVLACALLMIMAYSLDLLVWLARRLWHGHRVRQAIHRARRSVDAWNAAHPDMAPITFEPVDVGLPGVWVRVPTDHDGQPERKQPPGA